MDEDARKKAVNQDIKHYKELKKINSSDEFNTYFNLLTKTAADKMLWAFTGDNVKTFDDFLRARGEVTSYLYPIQEVRGADAMAKHLEQQLNEYYNQA